MANGNQVQSLYNFMDQLNRNNVRTQNLFEMRVFIPNLLTNKLDINGSVLTKYLNPNFTFYGQGFELPSRSLQYADVGFKGFTVPVPTVMKMTQDHSVTINADINGEMRRAFLAWQALTMNPQIDDNGGYFEGNRHLADSSKIRISLLDPIYGDAQHVIETYTLYGVTVQEVGTMAFSNSGSDVATFTVQFKSQYWQYGRGETGGADESEMLKQGILNPTELKIGPSSIH